MNHITLNTGHIRLSPRSEVLDEITAALQPVITRALEGGQVNIPPTNSFLTVEVWGRNLLVVIWDVEGRPLTTVGIGVSDAAGVWEELHRNPSSKLVTAPETPPEEPWCAARLELSALLHLDTMKWLGDFERCLAWAWIERQR